MTPKHKAILAQLPVGKRAAATAYYEELARYEAERSEFRLAQTKINNAGRQLYKARQSVPEENQRFAGKLYVDLNTGKFYEGQRETSCYVTPIKSNGYAGNRKSVYPRGPLVELPDDHPLREKRKVALLCKKLEGEG